VNKSYVDTNFLSKNGGVIFGAVSMNKNPLFGIPDIPQFGYSAVNRNYVQSELTNKLNTSGGSLTGNLNMGNNLIENVKTPLNNTGGVNKAYVDEKIEKSHLNGSH